MSFKLSHLVKAEKSMDIREIDIHLAEVLRLIISIDFAPALTLHCAFFFFFYLTNVRTSAEERDIIHELITYWHELKGKVPKQP